VLTVAKDAQGKSWKTSLGAKEPIQNGHSDSPKASSPYSFLRAWLRREIMLQLMMMMMSENHTMPFTGPWDSDSGY
jgi:hypothetical protein